MLKQVRTALKGVVAWFVIVLLVLAFALFGVPEISSFAQRAPLEVGDARFSRAAITEEFNRQINARRAETGQTMSRDEAIAAGLPDLVVNSLATRSVLEQEARKLGLVMPRALLREYLKNDERFQNPTTGEFDELALQGILQNNGISVRQFEALITEDLLRSQLIDSLGSGGAAPAPMVEALLQREVEQRSIAYLTMTDELAGPAEAPTAEALKQYYDQNVAQFSTPELRAFTAVIVRNADFQGALEVSEEDLRRLYEANRERLYQTPETRTLYQVTFDGEAEARAAVAALRNGKPFENVAAERGLTLAAVTFTDIARSAILDPAVAEAAFAPDLGVGGVSEAVQGLFGWTVVQVAGLTPATLKTFEEVRDEIEADFLSEDTTRKVYDAVEAVEEARDTGAGLVAAAEGAGLAVTSFGPVDNFSFGSGGEIVADIPGEVLETAFALEEGEESPAGEFEDGSGYYFVQVDEVSPPAARPYEDVAAEVETRWRRDERARRIEAAATRLAEAIRAGQSFESAAGELNRTPLTATIGREATEVFSAPLIMDLFRADKGAVVEGPAGNSDARIVAEVRDIGYAMSRINPQQEASFRQYVGYQLDQELLEAYVTALREDYGVRTDAAQITQIFSDGQ